MSRARIRSAIMEIVAPSEDDDGPASTGLTIHLWRADMVTGILELAAPGSQVVKADKACAMLFGRSPHQLVGKEISTCVRGRTANDEQQQLYIAGVSIPVVCIYML